MFKFAVLLVLASVSSIFAQTCVNPKITDVQTFSTSDAKLNIETAYTVQFKVQCSNEVKNPIFVAEVEGAFLTAANDASGENFQVSWSDSQKTTSRSRDIKVRLFDEAGYSAIKKAQRNNEDVSKVKELNTVSFYHQGSYSGPVVQPELVATVIFAVIYYWAMSIRSNLQA